MLKPVSDENWYGVPLEECPAVTDVIVESVERMEILGEYGRLVYWHWRYRGGQWERAVVDVAIVRPMSLDVVARHQHVAVGDDDPIMARRPPALEHVVELRIAARSLVADEELAPASRRSAISASTSGTTGSFAEATQNRISQCGQSSSNVERRVSAA